VNGRSFIARSEISFFIMVLKFQWLMSSRANFLRQAKLIILSGNLCKPCVRVCKGKKVQPKLFSAKFYGTYFETGSLSCALHITFED
jgi:hypothetical protein